jgi:hypothetical protein
VTGGSATAPGATGSCATYQLPLSGAVAIAGIAKDVNALSAFLDALAKAGDPNNPDVVAVWLANAQQATFGTANVITFQVNAVLASGARSDRLQTFFKGAALCK